MHGLVVLELAWLQQLSSCGAIYLFNTAFLSAGTTCGRFASLLGSVVLDCLARALRRPAKRRNALEQLHAGRRTESFHVYTAVIVRRWLVCWCAQLGVQGTHPPNVLAGILQQYIHWRLVRRGCPHTSPTCPHPCATQLYSAMYMYVLPLLVVWRVAPYMRCCCIVYACMGIGCGDLEESPFMWPSWAQRGLPLPYYPNTR